VTIRLATIGFGEAARAFAPGWAASGAEVSAYDLLLDRPAARAPMLAAIEAAAIRPASSSAAAIEGATLILSLVTADQALAAAEQAAPSLPMGALWCDMNSVAPDTKRAAARMIEAAGGRYVDVAVLAPVHPQRSAVPLLLSGQHAEAAAEALAAVGFAQLRVVPGEVGRASAIKMIRSVMVKGIEALSAECALAAQEAGVLNEVVASLDASWPGADWARRFDYNLDRMLVHGVRRAAEMEEVVKTLDALGTGSMMTRGTVQRQRALGALRLAPPDGLDGKLARLLGHDRSDAA